MKPVDRVSPAAATAPLCGNIAAWMDRASEPGGATAPCDGEIEDVLRIWLQEPLFTPICASVKFIIRGMASGRFRSGGEAVKQAVAQAPPEHAQTLLDLLGWEG